MRIAAAWVLEYPIVVVMPSILLACRRIELAPTAYLRSLWLSVPSTLLMSVTVVTAPQVYPSDLPADVARSLDIAIGPLAYEAATFGFHRKRVQAFLDLTHRAKK